MHRMLAVNADAVALYLNAQIDAGAQAVMVFDSWGGVLADGAFQEFSLAYTRRVLAQLHKTWAGATIPSIVFTKGGGLWLEEMAELDCNTLGVDWTVNLTKARALVGGRQGVAGQPRPQCAVCQPAQHSKPRCKRCSPPLARPTPAAGDGRPTSSTWATASASTRRRSTWQRWCKRCMSSRGRCAERQPAIQLA
jgi:uroporphyrinogen decarboxylase